MTAAAALFPRSFQHPEPAPGRVSTTLWVQRELYVVLNRWFDALCVACQLTFELSRLPLEDNDDQGDGDWVATNQQQQHRHPCDRSLPQSSYIQNKNK